MCIRSSTAHVKICLCALERFFFEGDPEYEICLEIPGLSIDPGDSYEVEDILIY